MKLAAPSRSLFVLHFRECDWYVRVALRENMALVTVRDPPNRRSISSKHFHL